MKVNEKRLLEIDESLIKLQGDIDLDNYLAPTNRAEELQRFKAFADAGEHYNPQFTYDPLPDVKEYELKKLKELLNIVDPLESIYIEAIDVRLGEIEAARAHDPQLISSHTKKTYGQPDAALISRAWDNLSKFKPDQRAYMGQIDGRVYDAEELAQLCRDAMQKYGFNWKVIVKSEMGAKAAVDNFIKEFWIRADVKFHESLVKMMIVHEIGTHVLRSENGYAQPLKIFGRGLPAYQFTEEGLAEYAEEQCGALLEDTVYRISGRVIGVEKALTSSFWDTYETLKPYFDIDMAFDIAQRAKLGIHDTTQAGSYTKDYTYLAGLIKMHEFFNHANQIAIDALFAGKTAFHHFKVVAQLQQSGFLKPPKNYPEWLK